MVFYYEKNPSRVDSYLKINKWFNSQNKKLKTKKVKLIVLVNGFYRILYRLILFINTCKRISKHFTVLQVKMEAKKEILWNRRFRVPTFYKRRRKLRKYLKRAIKPNKSTGKKITIYPTRAELESRFRNRVTAARYKKKNS